jgi:slime mold repeat-containing protein
VGSLDDHDFGVPDGTPCDDANGCTGGDACRQGTCVGGAPTACAAATTCHEAPLCDPGTGACLDASAQDDGTACSARDACVPDGTCYAGACTSEHDFCDDFDVCTTDRCDGAGGCIHEPIAGSCWALRGVTTFSATALGHTCDCTARTVVPPLALYADGTFAFPGGRTTCGGQDLVVPPETGTWSRTGRRYRLTTTNLSELLQIAEQCTGATVPITRYRTRVTVAPSGRRLTGVHTERAHGAGDTALRLGAVTRFRGRPTDHGVAQPADTAGARRCGLALQSCLRTAVQDN